MSCEMQGFKKEEVRIRADKQGHVIVSGERQANANDTKILHFEQSYIVPQGCDIQATSAVLEDDTYYVIIPKKTNPTPTSDNSNNIQGNTERDDEKEKDPDEASFLEKLSKKLKGKRCLVFTAFLAFSLGLLVSHRYQSSPQKRAKERADADDA